LTDSSSLIRIIQHTRPDEIYNLAAQSHVAVSFEEPEYTADSDALGPLRILEAIRILGLTCTTRFYQASSSELYGLVREVPQSETTPFYPRSPYAVAKLYAYWITVNYREAYGIYACNGILFNHESPIRGETFVTRKITRAVAHILAGKQQELHLGNLDARRDWGYAPEYVEGMWRKLQQENADDFVLGTGEEHSVREFVEEAFGYVCLDWEKYVKTDPRYLRPTEVDCLIANCAKAREQLSWEPRITFAELVRIMVDADLEAAGLQAVGEGNKILSQKFHFWHQWNRSVSPAVQLMDGRAME